MTLCISATAGTLSREEKNTLKVEIRAMYAAFESGNARVLLDKTHPSVYRIAGGKSALEESLGRAMVYLRKHRAKYIKSELGSPTSTYPAGSEEVCFVPRTSVMEVDGKRVKTTGFLIAIRNLNGESWRYADSAGLVENPKYLSVLLPELQVPVELPQNTVEFLD